MRGYWGRVIATAPVTLVERPPTGPARGLLPAPVWLVVLLTACLVLFCGLVALRAWGAAGRKRNK